MTAVQHFPIARSILSAEALAELVESAYGLPVVECRLIKAMILDTYRVTTSKGLYILRVYPHKRRSLPEITSELDFLVYLHTQGSPVSIPIEQKSGEYLLTISAPEGVRYGALFTYADGQPLGENPASVRAYGRAIAQIHAIADTMPQKLTRAPLDLEMLLERPLRDLERVFEDRHDDWAFLRHVGDKIRPKIAALSTEAPAYGLCHGDVGAANVHVSENDQLTIFDFDFCGPGWRAYDVANFLTDESEEVVGEFLAGYEEIRVIPQHERDTFPLFQALQSIWVLGIRADYVNDWGMMYFPDRFVNNVLKFIRETAGKIE